MNDVLLQKLEEIESRRQFPNWVPRRGVSGMGASIHPILRRAIGLRGLEIPVGQWTEKFILDHALSEGVADILGSHITDEDNHDTQLQYLAEYYGCIDVPGEAEDLTDRWLDLDCHPLVKKMVLEAGVFFPILGMMGVYGKGDLLTQNVRQWISSDESSHVASSRVIIDMLRKAGENITVPWELKDLVIDTILYICGGVDEDKWLRASKSGMTTGKIEGGDRMSTVSIPEQFTQKSNREIMYQSKE